MIREIEITDVPSLFEVRVLTRENALTLEQLKILGITEKSIKEGINNSLRGWLYEVNDKVVGFAIGNENTGEMTVIALIPDFENKGIGKQLITKVDDWLFSQGFNEIWLTTDLDKSLRAYGFYLKQGWCDSKIENGNRYMVKSINTN